MQKKSTVLTILVLLGVSIVMAGCPRPHRHRPHIPRPHHLFQPQLPLDLIFAGHVSMTLSSDTGR